ncbi:unnamed protein product [Sphagnum jensenii]|uniref:Uncharacterized protein n=1 Tax=Sphagnum jensenii TaxID=128206 RepID=A0ABP1B640_9BRYO
MAHSNLKKLPAGPANEGMQVEAAEDQNPPPVLSAAEGTPTRFPIPGPPQPPMGQMPPPPPPPDLCWHDIIHALATMPPLYLDALYNISIEEYNTRLAVQMLHSHILHEAGIADAILQLEDRETLRPHEDGPNNNGNE